MSKLFKSKLFFPSILRLKKKFRKNASLFRSPAEADHSGLPQPLIDHRHHIADRAIIGHTSVHSGTDSASHTSLRLSEAVARRRPEIILGRLTFSLGLLDPSRQKNSRRKIKNLLSHSLVITLLPSARRRLETFDILTLVILDPVAAVDVKRKTKHRLLSSLVIVPRRQTLSLGHP